MWSINDGKTGITYTIGDKSDSYTIEMSGKTVSLIMSFGYDVDKRLIINRHVVFPGLRTRPNDTYASFQSDIPECMSKIFIDGKDYTEFADGFEFDGILYINSHTEVCKIKRTIFPSAINRCGVEIAEIKNTSDSTHIFSVNSNTVSKSTGPFGINVIYTENTGSIEIASGDISRLNLFYRGEMNGSCPVSLFAEQELQGRLSLINRLTGVMKLDSGDIYIDTMFHFAKLHAGENVFKTRCGLIHSPGGGTYYGAVWCNDQCEYSSPWFAYTADSELISAALNSYMLYTPFMDGDYKPIPSSVIAEGLDFWNGAGDRGDAAMYLYGGSHFALMCGDDTIKKQLYPYLLWCAEYCKKKTNAEGIVESDSDELEGRFPSGKANLSTSSLALGGYRLFSLLSSELKYEENSILYGKEAKKLSQAIETYFGAEVQGYRTYRYCTEEQNALRSWICLPLCVGDFSRAEGTVAALMSDKLRFGDGLLSRSNDSTYWDRSLLYALNGLFKAGYTDNAYEWLRSYSKKRLTKDAVPYAIEAYPEGNKRQLSAESALYCRIITEGLFGIKPDGHGAFTAFSRLPNGIDSMSLKNCHFCNGVYDLRTDISGCTIKEK